MERDEWAELQEDIDDAERLVHELNEELCTYTEDSDEWNSVFHELNEADNHLSYLRSWEADFEE